MGEKNNKAKQNKQKNQPYPCPLINFLLDYSTIAWEKNIH